MKICMLGAGALGSTFGAALADAGNDVCLVNHNQAHVDAINRNGLIVRRDGMDRTVTIPAFTGTETLSPVDLIVILVKSAQTSAAIASARNIVAPHTTVMSVQNGLGHEDELSDAVGRASVVAGKTYVGASCWGRATFWRKREAGKPSSVTWMVRPARASKQSPKHSPMLACKPMSAKTSLVPCGTSCLSTLPPAR